VKSKQQVYQLEIQEDDFANYEDDSPDSEPFDIDTHLSKPYKHMPLITAQTRIEPVMISTFGCIENDG
jgi:hypothetical protein